MLHLRKMSRMAKKIPREECTHFDLDDVHKHR